MTYLTVPNIYKLIAYWHIFGPDWNSLGCSVSRNVICHFQHKQASCVLVGCLHKVTIQPWNRPPIYLSSKTTANNGLGDGGAADIVVERCLSRMMLEVENSWNILSRLISSLETSSGGKVQKQNEAALKRCIFFTLCEQFIVTSESFTEKLINILRH